MLASVWAFGSAVAQSATSLPPGPKVSIITLTQPIPNVPQYTLVDKPWFGEELPKRSGGRLVIKTGTWAENSLSGPEILRLTRSGQVDIGAAPLTTVSGDVPLLDGVDLAGMSPDIQKARRIAEAAVPTANKELERVGVRILGVFPYPAQVIFCRQGFSSIADLKGRKIRTFGASLNDFVTALGMQPVSIGFPEVYSALERGVVDCAVTGSGSGNSGKWPEVTTHMTTLPLFWAVTAYYANLAWWNKLDPAVRGFLEANIKEIVDLQWKLGADGSADGIACNTGKADGCKIFNLVTKNPMTAVAAGPADQAQISKIFADTVLPGWVKRCGARCGELYNEVIAPISGVKYVAK